MSKLSAHLKPRILIQCLPFVLGSVSYGSTSVWLMPVPLEIAVCSQNFVVMAFDSNNSIWSRAS